MVGNGLFRLFCTPRTGPPRSRCPLSDKQWALRSLLETGRIFSNPARSGNSVASALRRLNFKRPSYAASQSAYEGSIPFPRSPRRGFPA